MTPGPQGPTRYAGIAALAERAGAVLGASGWVTVGQDRIDAFADATGDHQWIHVDRERASRESPYGGTVAHGFLTLSLLSQLVSQAYAVDSVGTRVNYGLNRVRFPAPVQAGRRVRGVFTLLSVEEQAPGRHLVTVSAVIEVEGGDRPACTAETLALYLA